MSCIPGYELATETRSNILRPLLRVRPMPGRPEVELRRLVEDHMRGPRRNHHLRNQAVRVQC